MAYVKLDEALVHIIHCPLCKNRCNRQDGVFVCRVCGSSYSQVGIGDEPQNEQIYDFRIHRPACCTPAGLTQWSEIQKHYEAYHQNNITHDPLEMYRQQIESVRDLYTQQFCLTGSVLDVGGHQGRLRHFLRTEDLASYIATDPFPEVFKGLGDQPNLLRAYPRLNQPCNFIASHAEALPLASGTFDWVHMRSVLDHFEDPFVALKEAYRVLKPQGKCLIGLTVIRDEPAQAEPVAVGIGDTVGAGGVQEHPNTIDRHTGNRRLINLIHSAVRQIRRPIRVSTHHQDDHMFMWRYSDLVSVLKLSGFTVLKEHWQTPTVIYLMASKQSYGFGEAHSS